MTEMQRFDWEDIEFTGLATVKGHSVDWKIVEICGRYVDDGKLGQGNMIWGPSLGEDSEDPETAESFLTCWVKWDGCSHWNWPTDCSVHICGVSHARNVAAMMERVFEVTGQILPTWDAGVAT